MSMKCSIVRCLLLASLLFVPAGVCAETKELVTDATYTMGDGETPAFAEAMALRKAKQTALEQAGTYVQSYSKAHNFDLTVEEIQTLAGGVLKVDVLEKKRTLVGDGLLFYVKIKALVTTDEMEELARRIKGRDIAAEYAQLKKNYEQLAQELERWKRSAAMSPAGAERDAALEQVREREKSLSALQKDESHFIQRLVSGRLLVAEAANRRAQIDGLIETIKKDGHIIRLGQVRATEAHKVIESHVLTVPVTLKISGTLAGTLKSFFERMGGLQGPEVSLRIKDYHIGEDAIKAISPQSTGYSSILSTITMDVNVPALLFRVAQDGPDQRYILDRIRNLRLVIEFRFTGGGQGSCKAPPIVNRLVPIFVAEKSRHVLLDVGSRERFGPRQIEEIAVYKGPVPLPVPPPALNVPSGSPSAFDADNSLAAITKDAVFTLEVILRSKATENLEQVTARFDDDPSVKQWCNLVIERSEP